MKKLTTQATITAFIKQENEKYAITHSVITFIRHANNENINPEKIQNIRNALTEAISNAITFAYPNKKGKVSVSISIYDNKVLRLKVTDYGCGIEDISKAMTPLFSTEEGRSGLGFPVLKSSSDKLTVNSTVGKGTIVTMEFNL